MLGKSDKESWIWSILEIQSNSKSLSRVWYFASLGSGCYSLSQCSTCFEFHMIVHQKLASYILSILHSKNRLRCKMRLSLFCKKKNKKNCDAFFLRYYFYVSVFIVCLNRHKKPNGLLYFHWFPIYMCKQLQCLMNYSQLFMQYGIKKFYYIKTT